MVASGLGPILRNKGGLYPDLVKDNLGKVGQDLEKVKWSLISFKIPEDADGEDADYEALSEGGDDESEDDAEEG